MSARGERVPSPSGTLRIALSLARQGWPVFPVTIYRDDAGKRHKVPAVPRGTSWKDWATTDAETIATAWQGEHRECWVGVWVGKAGLIVLDVDKEPHDGRAFLRANDLTPPKTFRYRTLGGGTHHIYRAPAGEWTNAQGVIVNGTRIAGCDVRGGGGLFVYYGPELTEPPTLVEAPSWLLVPATPKAVDAAPSADEAAWRERLPAGKPSKRLRKEVERTDFPAGAAHEPMLLVVTALVKAATDGEQGIAELADRTRARYVGNHPDRGRDWDNALAGSIRRLGMPPATLPLTKAERRSIEERNAPKAVKAAKAHRRAAIVYDRIVAADQITQSALAEVLAEELAGKWANHPGLGLLRYDGVVWAPADELTLAEWVRRRLRTVRADVTREAIMRHDVATEKEAKGLEARSVVMAVARFIAGILLEATPELDADPDVLNVLNGVVDLRTGKLRERSPDDFFTKVAAAEYHPGATHPDWKAALKALPKQTRDWVKVRLGQASTGRISADKSIPFFLGGGDNGKSAVVGAARHALGSYSVTVPEKLLLGSDGDHPTDIMTLQGARLAVFEELPRGRRLNAQRIKLLAGTNELSGRRMRMDFVTFRASHTLVGATNHLPVVTDVDDAIWNRIAPVPFPYTFIDPEEKGRQPKPGTSERLADPDLRDRLAEADGDRAAAVLAWLVEGAVESYRHRRQKPPAVLNAWEEWRGEADPVMAFVTERLEFDEASAIAAVDLYHEFGAFLEARGQQRWSDQLIATSFTGHSSLDGVQKRQVKFGPRLMPSRPPLAMKALPERGMSWVGVRFRSAPPSVPMSPEVAELEERMRA